jgi:hypothetical protein
MTMVQLVEEITVQFADPSGESCRCDLETEIGRSRAQGLITIREELALLALCETWTAML